MDASSVSRGCAVAQADIGGRAAHVEAENARESARARPLPARRPRLRRVPESTVRTACRRGFLGRHEAAVRLHDRDAMAAGALQFAQIFVHQRPDVGVDQRGGGALVLAKFGADIVRRAQIAQPLRALQRRSFSLRGIAIGVQKADGDGLDSRRGASESSSARFRRWMAIDRWCHRNSVRSCTPKHMPRGMMGDRSSGVRLYSSARFWRPIWITSSKPAVVTSAVRAPLRSSSALVATVEPWITSARFAGRGLRETSQNYAALGIADSSAA